MTTVVMICFLSDELRFRHSVPFECEAQMVLGIAVEVGAQTRPFFAQTLDDTVGCYRADHHEQGCLSRLQYG